MKGTGAIPGELQTLLWWMLVLLLGMGIVVFVLARLTG